METQIINRYFGQLKKTKSICIISIVIIFLVSMFQFAHWKINIDNGDSWGYYSYLPATFIHNDLGEYAKTVETTQKYNLHFEDPLLDQYGLYHKHPTTGKNIIKYTSGVAVLLSPFFFIAHFLAGLLGLAADGFSPIYKLILALGVIFWVSIGLWCLYTVLEKYFSQFVVVLTIMAISLATNLYYNTSLNSIMSHGLLFSLYSILIYATQKYFDKPSLKKAFFLGLVAGLISLTRMTELYCLLIPLLWGINSVKERFSFFIHNYKHLLIAVFTFIILFIPQLIYWKLFTGDWVHDGYIGESFNFRNPKQIYLGLFSFDNGWLVWSPVMIFSLIGILFVRKKASDIFWPMIILVPLHIYVIYSWWCYNYINGFGSRPMEHMYPILAFSLGSLFFYFSYSRFTKVILVVIISFLAFLNMFQTYQVTKGILITNFSSLGYYYHLLWQTKSNHNILASRTCKQIQPSKTKLLSTIYFENFEDTTQFYSFSNEIKMSGNFSRKITEESIIFYSVPKSLMDSGNYLKVSLNCYFTDEVPQLPAIWDLPYLYIQWLDENDQSIYDYEIGIYPFQYCGNPEYSIYSHGERNTWGLAYYFIRIPNVKFSKANLGLWNPKKVNFYMDNLTIELHQ